MSEHDDRYAGRPRPGPPWGRRYGHWKAGHWAHSGAGRPRLLFLRLAAMFGLFVLLLMGGLALLIFLLVRLAGGDSQTAAFLWLNTCGLLLALPLLAGWVGRRAFRSIALPLGQLMNAADAVAAGDLSVRVPVRGRGEFSQLSTAFNRMVEELALADQRRRNLTADVAHELRTPLQIIHGNLEGIVDGVYEPTPEHINATLDETRLLARLVEDLRVLSQAEAGQLSMQKEAVDIAELLADVATSFGARAESAGIDLQTNVRGDLIVTGDYGRLDQALSNLVANAVRHTAAGGSVELRAWREPETVRIVVSDTGEGIAADDLPYIFDRFWRGDRARAHTAVGGSGLGLAITRQLIQAHAGRISAESEVGRGTAFTIDLPAYAPGTQP